MYQRILLFVMVIGALLLQLRNFNRYRVERRRKHEEARVYLESDVCADAITRAQLGKFNLCESAEHIIAESPTTAAMYDILNDWYPCGHGRCDGVLDWFYSRIHWIVLFVGVLGTMIYFKWVDYQNVQMFSRMQLPTRLVDRPHVD